MKLAKPAGDCSKTSVFTSKSEKTGWAGALSTEWLEGAADLIPDRKKYSNILINKMVTRGGGFDPS